MDPLRLHRVPPVLLERARAMRHEPTRAEHKIWTCVRDRQLDGFKFKRQHRLGPFIVDFYCAETKLVVELDGDPHADQVRYDEDRTKWLSANGYRVIRFTNDQVREALDAVLEQILRDCETVYDV